MKSVWININLIIKRLGDIVLSFLGLAILSPFLLIMCIIIKCDSKGPAIFKQERRSKDGKIFLMHKFRSMVVDAENQGAGLFNFAGDPRVTKVGRWMRDHSVDELPQLWNVVKGDISLVGPRPCVKYELGEFETLNKKYMKRFAMKAGITGYAQVHGRNDIRWDEKVVLDNIYIDMFKKQGIFLDIKLLFQTFLGVYKTEDICEKKVDESLDDAEAAKLAEAEIIRLAHLPDEE